MSLSGEELQGTFSPNLVNGARFGHGCRHLISHQATRPLRYRYHHQHKEVTLFNLWIQHLQHLVLAIGCWDQALRDQPSPNTFEPLNNHNLHQTQHGDSQRLLHPTFRPWIEPTYLTKTIVKTQTISGTVHHTTSHSEKGKVKKNKAPLGCSDTKRNHIEFIFIMYFSFDICWHTKKKKYGWDTRIWFTSFYI